MRKRIEEMREWLIETRRDIHMHPELGFEEERTSALVSEWLERFGLNVTKGLAKTGVVGFLKGAHPGKTVAIRADMDALPLQEMTSASYRSTVEGKMHACGHDAHVTILLGVARYFSEIAHEVRGNIKWIFQPAEEGGGGGRVLVEEGVLENPNVDAIFAAHVFPFLDVGRVGVYSREALASSDRFTLRLEGKGGHAGLPHAARDPILAAGHAITQLHSIVSRINPIENGVVTIGKVNGGTAANIIPDQVELTGTVRSLTPEIRGILKTRIEEVSEGVSRSFGVQAHLDFNAGYPALVNDPEMTRLVETACRKGIGGEHVELLRPAMGSEDFAYYLEKIPGAFFRLGCRNEKKGIIHPYHNPRFDIDEDVLAFGVEVFVGVINEFLGESE